MVTSIVGFQSDVLEVLITGPSKPSHKSRNLTSRPVQSRLRFQQNYSNNFFSFEIIQKYKQMTSYKGFT